MLSDKICDKFAAKYREKRKVPMSKLKELQGIGSVKRSGYRDFPEGRRLKKNKRKFFKSLHVHDTGIF